MSTELYVPETSEPTTTHQFARRVTFDASAAVQRLTPVRMLRFNADASLLQFRKHPSAWSRSGGKRVFDCICVLAMLPLLVPIFLVISLAVWLTSPGPVLFLQKRMGRQGRIFTIIKFRTMIHSSDRAHLPVTTSGNQLFTPVGPFLRCWKLDELPQLLNVLAGHMSLVGPRPKLPEHAISDLPCRAGITGAATIAFAREEEILDRVPMRQLDSFYHSVVLPAKHRLDAEYMAQATFLSDLKLIVDSVLRRWDSSIGESLLATWAVEQGDGQPMQSMNDLDGVYSHAPMLAKMDRPASTGEASAF